MDNAEIIWNYLKSQLNNEYGIAGLMGNLQAESALSPTNLQDSFNKAWGVTDQQFTQMVDNGQFDFCCNDKGYWGYGLAQWTSVGRRINLWKYKCQKQVSIGDINMQLEFLVNELKTSYKPVYNAIISATSIQEASDIVLTRFEIPADQSASVKKYRASLGQKFYDRFHSVSMSMNDPLQKAKTSKKYIVKVDTALNIRYEPNTNSRILGGLPNNAEITVSQFQGNWGFVPEYNGWVCMDYTIPKE